MVDGTVGSGVVGGVGLFVIEGNGDSVVVEGSVVDISVVSVVLVGSSVVVSGSGFGTT